MCLILQQIAENLVYQRVQSLAIPLINILCGKLVLVCGYSTVSYWNPNKDV